MEPFLIKALFSGIAIAIVASSFGCFVLWKRMSNFSDTFSHSALLGVAIGLLLNIDIIYSCIGIGILFALLLYSLRMRHSLDSLLVIISQSSLAISLLIIAFIPIRVDLTSFLFGDILSISNQEIILLYVFGIIAIYWLIKKWRALLTMIISEDLAQIEGIKVKSLDLQFLLMISMIVALSFKLIGAMLLSSLIIMPAASTRNFCKSPYAMVMMSVIISILAIVAGLIISSIWDISTSATIVGILFFIFILSNLLKRS